MLNDGHPLVDGVKEIQVPGATRYRWLNQYRSEKNAEASKRTKGTGEGEHATERLPAEEKLAIDILNEVAKGAFRAPNSAALPCPWQWRSSGPPDISLARSAARIVLPSGRRDPIRASRKHGSTAPCAPSRSTTRHGDGGNPAGACSPRSWMGWRSTTSAYARSGARKASSVNPRRGRNAGPSPVRGITRVYREYWCGNGNQPSVAPERSHLKQRHSPERWRLESNWHHQRTRIHKASSNASSVYLETSFLPGRRFTSPTDFNTQLQGWLR
ncbi:hypothetical protein BKP42_58440 [Rhodococcus erythropolis]|nr:hypothetical protein BKP42_58440 [Rhodococcus erythropolis]